MKKYLMFMSAIVLGASTIFMSSCKDDEGGDPVIVEPSLIKTISIDYSGGAGEEVESWQFNYDANDRIESIDVFWNGESDGTTVYDYSVANQLTITRGENSTVYALNADGLVIKEFWDSEKTEWEGYEYNSDGQMIKVVEHYGGTDHLKYDLTISDGNVTNRIRYNDDGTVREDREFTYTIGDNLSGIHQIYQVDSEWKNVGGTFGKQSAKLADGYLRKITEDPTSAFTAKFEYTFDEQNRVATQTKNGTSSGGPFSESWAYTYYED
ncbi:MAG: hypothetical protein RIC30_20740 [Marinoscillum sp.]|uniref:DUF4595 domain-containing protein n=1 Tax=Marinoscillum sp. TaxID=2024838 RepID=UPI0032FE94DF